MSKTEQAVDCMKQTFSCSQAILSTYGPELGLDREMALRVAGSFGGGMARMGETCGAVTGALMVIGLKYGNTRADDKEAKEQTYRVVTEFVEKFRKRHYSTLCRELVGCDLGTPEGMQFFKEQGLANSVCLGLVRDAGEILEELLP
jgi:C_GCAxxG_C_C family probable redox protein